jgi:hypothetical protein
VVAQVVGFLGEAAGSRAAPTDVVA